VIKRGGDMWNIGEGSGGDSRTLKCLSGRWKNSRALRKVMKKGRDREHTGFHWRAGRGMVGGARLPHVLIYRAAGGCYGINVRKKMRSSPGWLGRWLWGRVRDLARSFTFERGKRGLVSGAGHAAEVGQQ